MQEEISRIPTSIMYSRLPIMRKMAKAVQKNVVNYFKDYESDIPSTTSNYDGTIPYVHMANDVKVTAKDDNQGYVYAIIKGGKYTGYKWHMVENGTSHSRAMHLIEKALNNTEGEIEAIVDEAIRRAVQGGD